MTRGTENEKQREPKRKKLMPNEIKQIINQFARRYPLENNGRAIRIALSSRVIIIDYSGNELYRVWSSSTSNNIAKYTGINCLLSSTDTDGIEWKHIERILTFQKSALDSMQLHNWTMEFIGENRDFGAIRSVLEKRFPEITSDVETHFVRKLQDTDGQVKKKSQLLNRQRTIIVEVYQTISKCFCNVIASIKTDEDEDEDENEVSLTIRTCFDRDILPQLSASTDITIKEFPLSTFDVQNTQDSQILEQFKTFLELTAKQIYDWLTHHNTFYSVSEHPPVYIKNHDAEDMIQNFLRGTNPDDFTE